MIGLVVIAFLVAGSAAMLLGYVANNTMQTRRHIARTEAFFTAEAGLDRAIFILAATEDWTALETNPPVSWSNPDNESYGTFSFSEISSGEVTVFSSGRKSSGYSDRSRCIEAHITHGVPEAFGYALFGNRVGFHNHMKVDYGLTITSHVWSNGELLLHRGLSLSGDMTAVGEIVFHKDPSGMAETITSGKLRDGKAGSAYYAPDFGEPVPEKIPFPQYDFADAKAQAQADGTYFPNATAFQIYIDSFTTDYSTNRQAYEFPSPLPDNPTNVIPLTSSDGSKIGIVSEAVISGEIFYIEGDLTLAEDCDTLLIVNGAIVVDGKLTIKRPIQILATPTVPAIAATGKVDITDKDHTDGDGGPVTIRGIVYTLDESHIHQSDDYNAVSVDGIEVANYIHNCEWFWFNYTPWPGVKGFSEGSGAQALAMSRWREVYATAIADASGVEITGEISINPNNSPDNEFVLKLADSSTVTRDDLVQSYSGCFGEAVSIHVMPKGGAQQNGLIVDGVLQLLSNDKAYDITAGSMYVELYNDNVNPQGKAVGKWRISILSDNATLIISE